MATKANELTLGCIPYGTVYLIDPELSAEDRRADLETIRNELGFNTVVLWPVVSRWEGNPPGEMAFTRMPRGPRLAAR